MAPGLVFEEWMQKYYTSDICNYMYAMQIWIALLIKVESNFTWYKIFLSVL